MAQTQEDLRELPVGDLAKRLSEQTTALVRQELQLAQAELTEKGKRAGIGGGLFGAAGLVALYGLGALVASAILALATAVDGWAAALIVAGVLFAIAAVAALVGKGQIEQATPPAPERAQRSVKADVAEVKERARNG